MLRGPSPCSGLIILYYPNRGWWVPSNIYRGSRGPSFAVEGFPPCFTGVPGDPLIRHNIFCKHFVAGLGEALKVPPISAGVPASCVRIPSLFHIASGVTRRKRVGILFFLQGSPAVGRGEACMVPLIPAGVPASHVRVPSISHIASGVRGRKRVRCLIFCRGSLLPGRQKRVWCLQFLQASLPHASVYPPCFTLPEASGGGSVQGSLFFGGIPRC